MRLPCSSHAPLGRIVQEGTVYRLGIRGAKVRLFLNHSGGFLRDHPLELEVTRLAERVRNL